MLLETISSLIWTSGMGLHDSALIPAEDTVVEILISEDFKKEECGHKNPNHLNLVNL